MKEIADKQVQARHVFHAPTAGSDRVQAWQEATGEPVFTWGRGPGGTTARFFGPLKREFRRWLGRTAGAALTIYHDGAGADALAPLDPGAAKVFFLHHWYPRWQPHFEWGLRFTGQVLVGDAGHAARLRAQYRWIPERFIQWAPQPQLKPAAAAGAARQRDFGGHRRTGIWLHGRAWRSHGNRLRAIADRWPAQAGQLEIVAAGHGRPAWARRDHIVWSMDLPLEFALMRLHTWDSTLLLNDFSLDAPWLLEALSLGCFPLVPDGDGASRTAHWQEPAAPRPYPWGEVPAALELLHEWRAARPRLWPEFNAWSRALAAAQQPAGGWSAAWEAAKAALLEHRMPRIPARRALGGWYPVALYERVQRMRMGL